MKVLNSISSTYNQQIDLHHKLRDRVDILINVLKKDTWYYSRRIKELESFALKVETGRFNKNTIFDDLLACTLVVENSTEIENAIEKIKHFFDIVERRPISNKFTTKFPDTFPYDDLRLYVTIKPQKGLPPSPLNSIKFEIQIKTFLQHAWTIATHDPIYKSEEISWAKQRIAYQIKAMLEHAEISIHELDQIKNSAMLDKENYKFQQLKQIKKFLMDNWKAEFLPKDQTRLSHSILNLLNGIDLSIKELQKFLDLESRETRGINTMNLPPYFIIIQTIINQNPDRLIKFCSDKSNKDKIVIPSEIDLKNLSLDESKIIHF